MKKLLLVIFTAIVGLPSYAQGPLAKTWEVKPLATGSLVGTAGLETTIAYNMVTDKLYLPERNNKISILKPADGTISSPATLTTLTSASHTGWGASYKYTKLRVTTDGVIYACNMTLSGTADLYIYRWASETDLTPTVSTIDVGYRTGDSFAVTGTGVNTVIYISGANSPEIYVCKTTDGVTFTLDHVITVVASDARSSISAVSNSLTSDLWINTLNVEAKRISSNATGTVTATSNIVTSLIDQKYSHIEYIQEGTQKYLAVSGAHDATLGLNFKLYKITDFPTPTTAVTEVGSGVLAPAVYTSNPNAYADVAYKKNVNDTYTFFHLSTNNGLAAYTTASVLPVTFTSFAASFTNNYNSLTWATSSESDNFGFDVESSTDGVSFSKIGFVPSKSSGNSSEVLTYSFEDKLASAGTTYYRLKQVDKNGEFEYTDIKFVKNPLLADKNAFTIYPNPATDYVYIAGGDQAGVEVRLFSATGAEINVGGLFKDGKLNMTSLNSGAYILKITKNGKLLQTSKLIRE